MKYFIVEITHAYKVPANSPEEAIEKFNEDPSFHEKWHEDAGFFVSVNEPFEAEPDETIPPPKFENIYKG